MARFEEMQRILIEGKHSRYPVADENLDDVVGIAHVKELFTQTLSDKKVDLKTNSREPLYVPENARAFNLLDAFRQSNQHVALVVDEYGGLAGLVTVVDVLEALVGEIPTVFEAPDPEATQREDGSWLVDGMFPVREFKELVGEENMPTEDKVGYETMSGLVMARLGRIPEAGDEFAWGEFQFEVLDMDGRRVNKVLVK